MKFRKQLKQRYVWKAVLFRLPLERCYYVRIRKHKNKPLMGLMPFDKWGN